MTPHLRFLNPPNNNRTESKDSNHLKTTRTIPACGTFKSQESNTTKDHKELEATTARETVAEARAEEEAVPGSNPPEPVPSELPPLPVPRTPRSTNPVAIQTEPDPERENRETQVWPKIN